MALTPQQRRRMRFNQLLMMQMSMAAYASTKAQDLSAAAELLATWANSDGGLAADFTDITSSQTYGSMKIIDGATPANNWETTSSLTPFNKLTWTGASLRMCYGSDGVLRYAPHNLQPYSQQFDNAAWTKNTSGTGSVTVTADYSTAPDGTTTADRIQFDLGATPTTAVARMYAAGYTLAGHTNTIWLKTNDGSSKTISFRAAVTGYANTIVVTGTWQKFSVVFDFETQIGLFGSGSGFGVTTDTSADLLAWGAHSYQTPVHSTDYIATTSSAVYKPRIDYDPSTLAVRGLLVEEARTNSLLYSNAITTSPWVVGEFTYSSPVTGADGTTNLNKMIESTTASAFHFARQTVNTSAATYTSSAIVKAAERRIALVAQDSAGTNQAIVVFDVSGAQVGPSSTTGTGFSVSGTPTITSIGGGLYRVVASFTVPSSATNQFLYLLDNGTGTGAASLQYTGNGTSGVYIGYCQVELGAFATSYIPTTSASVTRAADAVSIATSAFNLGSAYTIYMSVTEIGDTASAGVAGYFSVNDTTSSNRSDLRANGTGFVTSGGATQATLAWTKNAIRTRDKVALAVAANDVQLVTNNNVNTADATVTMPVGPTLVNIGTIDNNVLYTLSGHYEQIMLLPKRLSNANLQTLTT